MQWSFRFQQWKFVQIQRRNILLWAKFQVGLYNIGFLGKWRFYEFIIIISMTWNAKREAFWYTLVKQHLFDIYCTNQQVSRSDCARIIFERNWLALGGLHSLNKQWRTELLYWYKRAKTSKITLSLYLNGARSPFQK